MKKISVIEVFLENFSFSLNNYYTGYVESTLKKHYDKIDVEVHGGLTYSGYLEQFKEKVKLKDNQQFYGFDTTHAGDSPRKQNKE